jgi:hypothetical protein
MKHVLALAFLLASAGAAAADTFVRFRVHEPADGTVQLLIGGYIHKSPWYLPKGRLPAAKGEALAAGEWSEWLNVTRWADGRLHGRLNRAGGVAEFPAMSVDIRCSADHPHRDLEIELATAADPAAVRKRLRERFTGRRTAFLVSPNLRADADQLETASEMTARRLAWAQAASGGTRISPTQHILQTSLWAAQRPELQRQELQVLSLLGFNVVGNRSGGEGAPELRVPGHSHRVALGPAATREQVEATMAAEVAKLKKPIAAGVPFGFKDEICARPRIGTNAQARTHLAAWLAAEGVTPAALGVAALTDVVPIETPEALRAAMAHNEAAARRVFTYTSRFRQRAGTERLRWNTEAFHRHAGPDALTSTLVADHPYFGGTGLGMGMVPNTTWGGAPLALDWFDIARQRAVDLIGIEDWMGLQFMYGPNSTWEGFQLMGFQAAIMRSGSISRGGEPLPIIAWITPSDETNFRLKSGSALCQGAKHVFFWTYGPTNTSTENYWSDLRSAYDGIATFARQLSFSEPLIADGRLRPARAAVLYSLASDLWQPFGYIHMLERRCAYLAFVQAQYRVDFLTEDDVDAGRLAEYDVLWTSDPCIRTSAAQKIATWATADGHRLIGSCGAGQFNEFGEPADSLAAAFGYVREPAREWTVQRGRYRFRGGLNAIRPFARDSRGEEWIGLRGRVAVADGRGATVRATFDDGAPAEIANAHATYFCGTPAVSYAKAARFVPRALAEKWPASWRARMLTDVAARVEPAVVLSDAVVEAGLYDHPAGAALVLANFTYTDIEKLQVTCAVGFEVGSVASAERGELPFSQDGARVSFTVALGISDIVCIEPR